MTIDWGYRWLAVRCWWSRVKRWPFEHLAFRLAFWMPRALVYWCFIRVTAATGENPDSMTCIQALKAWERGAGR